MAYFNFHPELFEQRTMAMERLSDRGYVWLSHYSSVDLLHDLFGLEVCGIPDEKGAREMLEILKGVFPDWKYRSLSYQDLGREIGWKAMIYRRKAKGQDWK